MEARYAACPTSSFVYPFSGTNSFTVRWPSVIVPVLSRIRMSTSPAASTAFPDFATTFASPTRAIPATPIAGSSPPIVVGISATRRETRTATSISSPRWSARNRNAPTTTMKVAVSPINRIVRLISLGDFGRFAFSTREIIWSR
jgi:hypothetical protein